MVVKVREMILTGLLPPGSRVTEAGLADQLKVSRTPVRNVLPALAKEGLLVAVGRRGFAVKAFTAQESLTALELRSVLEGVRGPDRGAARRLGGPEGDIARMFGRGRCDFPQAPSRTG